MRDDFAVFILSHGRPNKQVTLRTLNKRGYTGKWYIICDNEDKTIDQYYALYGKEHIYVFDKEEAARRTDTMDTLTMRNSVVFARNMCHDIAKELGLTYFWELEDDYEEFRSRVWDGERCATIYCTDLDSVIDAFIEFLDTSGALTVAFAQTGDLLGGTYIMDDSKRVLRKAMNSFFCRTDNPFKFFGRMNDDVNTYVSLGSRGELFLTICDMTLDQQDTQRSKSGNSDMYKQLGTYCKSFYSVICNPSCVTVCGLEAIHHKRIHHRIQWDNAVPKIISDKFKVT